MQCPFCKQEIHDEARRCAYCQSLVSDFKFCPDCQSVISDKALTCPYCNHSFKQEKAGEPQASSKLFNLEATPLGAMISEFSITNLFLPPRIDIYPHEVILTRWSLFGLRRGELRISTDKIASVHLQNGVIWATIILETFGGAIPDLKINGLMKTQAKDANMVLKEVTKK